MRTIQRVLAVGLLAVGALGMAGVAQARDVYWSVGVGSPGVAVGVGNAPPPVYYEPAPVYVAPPPPPVYYAPPPAYYAPPPPVIYRPAPVYYDGYRPYRHHHLHRHPRWNRYRD